MTMYVLLSICHFKDCHNTLSYVFSDSVVGVCITMNVHVLVQLLGSTEPVTVTVLLSVLQSGVAVSQ